jgi:hypothetical protein
MMLDARGTPKLTPQRSHDVDVAGWRFTLSGA